MQIIKSIHEIGKIEIPKLFGIPTGISGFDDLFEIKGLPAHSVFNVVGKTGSGKSLFAEQFSIKQAISGYPVAYVTFNSPASFVALNISKKIDMKKLENKIIIIDGVSHLKLRNIKNLLDTLAYTIKKYSIKSTIIDPVDGLIDINQNKVIELFNFMKKWYQNSLFISNKVYGITDGVIRLYKKMIRDENDEKIYNERRGKLVRLIKIESCRLCDHDFNEHKFTIKNGRIVIPKVF